MAKKRVYVESTITSYLTAKEAKKPIPLLRQKITAVWWERRSEWDCFQATPVIDEIKRGDQEAAAKRLEKARLIPEFPIAPEADALADLLVARKLVPADKKVDAYHLALAAFYKADYLLTWNLTHLDNLELGSRIEELIRGWGLTPAKVITPERLLEETK